MDLFIDFFLENQLDLDADLPHPPTYECEHRWECVLITTRVLNAQEPGYACSRCGAEKYEDRFDRQDFDGGKAGWKSDRSEEPRCSVKTVRGHQCTYPSLPGKEMCKRHLKLSLKDPNLFKCLGCAAEIASRRGVYHPSVLVRRSIFHVLWSGVKIRSGDYEEEYAVSDESYCSYECWLDHSHDAGTQSPDDAHP